MPAEVSKVGGVQFEAFSRRTLGKLIDNHRRVKVRAIRRREAMEAWAYGTITGGGSRQPTGGRQGDGYGPYACHRGDTPDDIKALFRHAVVCSEASLPSCSVLLTQTQDTDILVEAGTSIYKDMQSQISWTTAEASVNRFGRYGLSTFYCHNYISPVHTDSDIGKQDLLSGCSLANALGGLYPCMQLTKTNCGPQDYNFAYVRWGMVIQTQPNTVW